MTDTARDGQARDATEMLETDAAGGDPGPASFPIVEPTVEEGVPPLPIRSPDSSFVNMPTRPLKPTPLNATARVIVFSLNCTVPPPGFGALSGL